MSLDIYLVNKDSPHSVSLAQKLSGPHEPGDIVFLSEGEFSALNAIERVKSVDGNNNSSIELLEVDYSKKYLAIVKDFSVNINDLLEIAENGLDMKVVRVR